MVIDSALLVLVLGILLTFGFAVARLVDTPNGLATAGMTAVFGTAFFLVLANALAYAVGTEAAFRATFIVMLIAATVMLAKTPRRWANASFVVPRWLGWTLGILAAIVGLMNARFVGSDPDAWTHFPLAAQIMRGNFPVTEAVNPWHAIGYHYGPAMLAAALTEISRVSLSVSYALQPLFGAVGVLLFSGAIVRSFTSRWKTVFVCSLLALGSMGFGWFHAAYLARDLFDHYVLGHHIAAPFRELSPMFASSYYTSSILNFLGHRPSAVGYPLLFGALFSLSRAFEDVPAKRRAAWSVVTVILMCALALSMETGLVLLMASVVAYAIGLVLLDLLERRTVLPSTRALGVTAFLILAVATVIVKHQGGILSTLSGDVSPDSFKIWFDGRLHFNPDGTSIALWDWQLYREFGLPLLLLPFSIAYAWRRRHAQPFLMLLCLLAIANYSAPFVLHFGARPHETNRLLFTALSVSGMLGGLVLGESLLISPARVKRALGWICIAAMLISSTTYLVFRLTFPTLRFESAPLFAGMPVPPPAEQRLFDWVNANTTYADHFYMGVNLAELKPPLNANPTDRQLPRILFMMETGRMTIGPILWTLSFPADKLALFDHLEVTCSAADFRSLQIRYLVIEDAARAAWFDRRCAKSDWKLAYGDSSGLPKIEELAVPSAFAAPR